MPSRETPSFRETPRARAFDVRRLGFQDLGCEIVAILLEDATPGATKTDHAKESGP
jgi:hypothetical protein